jgi:hypothetical protein
MPMHTGPRFKNTGIRASKLFLAINHIQRGLAPIRRSPANALEIFDIHFHLDFEI